jgi:hypothetical protein
LNEKREIAFKDLKKKGAIKVEQFHERNKNAWDEFVSASNNGTIFHTRQFINYHPKNRFRDVSLIFEKEQKCIALFPAAIKQEDESQVLISHPGGSMAGPVFMDSISIKDVFGVVEALTKWTNANAISKTILTLPPQIYHSRPSNYLDFALLEAGFTYLKREVSSVIPLDFAEEDTLLIFSPESRRAARKAEKLGVKICESDDFPAFYAILEKNLGMRHNVQPTHLLDELITLKRLFPDDIKLFGAFYNDQMIAGIVIFVCNPKVALAFYISHLEEMQQYRAVNALFYEVVRWSIRNRFKFLDFGIFTVNMKPNWGLARFKESFGAQGVFRDTLVKNI